MKTEYPIGSRWLNNYTGDCFEKREWGWKYIGHTNSHIPFPDVLINYDHEKDIIEDEN